ncbi:hypothetical protein COM13_09885 [Bacillus pseudomycoides]|nr:hypothetical protein COO07_25170 [Bacillus pseudomycoides]PEE07171.1 hypothetical protein CON86_05170 [Bacillus pseudomycoides]PEK82808.1 hypothetical protein CN597_01485 [Bacillus pseudomycoides]PEM38885.1 hypothetical protein CN634_11690 [Bacillus pseudomycoides]PEM77912.1 hypothetical protein CN632_08275 [Bacillus pseudomycoides]
MGESVRLWIEAVNAFFSPMPRETKWRKRVGIPFYFRGCDVHVGKSKGIYILTIGIIVNSFF